MLKYILKRIGLAVLIIFGVSVIIYVLMRSLPTDYIDNLLLQIDPNGQLGQEEIDRYKALYGLNDNYIVGYLKWLGLYGDKDPVTGKIILNGILQGNFGYSYKYGAPVMDVIFESMGLSFMLAFISTILQFVISIPLGIRAAVKQYGPFDYATTIISMMGISLPSFFFAGLIIKLFAVDLGWFDASLGFVSSDMPIDASDWTRFIDKVWHLILPIFVMVVLSIGGLMRYTRTNTLEVLNADYIRTARAKGVSERDVIYKHTFKNTMIPLVTMFAGILPGLFGGSMIIEDVFKIPGIGFKAYQALQVNDIPLVMGYNMFIAVLTVIGILLSDLMYAVVDPRVKIGK